jgi:anti-anti-sigma regulatory factor
MAAVNAHDISHEIAIVHDDEQFSHTDACRIFDLALRQTLGAGGARTVVIDLKRAEDATTSAFARLVLLRRTLLRYGRDLRLTGLRDRAAGVFEINRLASVLPCM